MAGYDGRLPGSMGNRPAGPSRDSELTDQFDSMTVRGLPAESPQRRQRVGQPQLVVGKLRHRGTTYNELAHLQDTQLIGMRPGLEHQGSILFVLVSRESVTHCKVKGASYAISDYDDQTTRFTLSGAPQLPVQVIAYTEGSIGMVQYDDGSRYDFYIEYHPVAQPNPVIARYNCIQPSSGMFLGEISFGSGQMNFIFSAKAVPELKALIISYGINRAFNAHRNYVVNTKLPYRVYEGALHRMYEGVLPQLEYGIIRAATRKPDGTGFVSILMDTKANNKILLVINFDERLDNVEAVDVRGNQVFRTNQLTNVFARMQVTCDNQFIGEMPAQNLGDTTMLNTIGCTPLRVLRTPARGTIHTIMDSPTTRVCTISGIEPSDPSPITAKVMIQRKAPTNMKKMVLAYAALCAYKYCQPHRIKLPRARLSSIQSQGMTTYTSGICYSPILRAPAVPEISILAPMSTGTRFVIRAAGYNKASGMQFYDVINHGTEDLVITIECSPFSQSTPDGDLIARSNRGVLLFRCPDFLAADLLSVYLPNGALAGYYSQGLFYDYKHREIMVFKATLPHPDCSPRLEYRWGLRYTYKFTDTNSRVVASLEKDDCALTLDTADLYTFTELQKSLMLAMTMRTNFRAYKFDQRPVPAIEYRYI